MSRAQNNAEGEVELLFQAAMALVQIVALYINLKHKQKKNSLHWPRRWCPGSGGNRDNRAAHKMCYYLR